MNIKKNRPCESNQALIDAAIRRRISTRTLEEEGTDEENIENEYAHEEEDNDDEEEGFEYLDHTADIQFHSWGLDISQALINLIKAMFNYMTDLDLILIDTNMSSKVAQSITAQGHDWKSLIYSFMNEWLFVFHDTGFIAKELDILSIDRTSFTITSNGMGEKMNIAKHTQGTEIKAITYSNMNIKETTDRCDIWVIVDI